MSQKTVFFLLHTNLFNQFCTSNKDRREKAFSGSTWLFSDFFFTKNTYESEFSDSVSLSSFLVHLHFLYLSMRSMRYEFFLAFLMNGYFNSSLAVGLCIKCVNKMLYQSYGTGVMHGKNMALTADDKLQ